MPQQKQYNIDEIRTETTSMFLGAAPNVAREVIRDMVEIVVESASEIGDYRSIRIHTLRDAMDLNLLVLQTELSKAQIESYKIGGINHPSRRPGEAG